MRPPATCFSLAALALLSALPVTTLAQGAPPTRPETARRDSTRRDSVQAVEALRVQATRGNRRVEDEPLRVEVLDDEEVAEKLMMTPGDIAMMLNESTGLRVQNVSPGLGSANVRMQGLRGRYTTILTDGLPLYGTQTGGLGLLQIPPMDLGGVELIKGVSSALYGGSALGGVINLVSRRPEDEPTIDLLANGTSLGGSDFVGFASQRISERWGYSLLLGKHAQQRQDLDGDNWADVVQYDRVVARPRLFWNSERGHSLMLTAGLTEEDRAGGTPDGVSIAGTAIQRPERLRTARADIGLVGQWLVGPTVLATRVSVSRQDHRHRFFTSGIEPDRHETGFAELSLNGAGLGGLWVLGTALQHERFESRTINVTGYDYAFATPGIFAQHSIDRGRIAVSASARLDLHSEYGNQLSPRLAALLRLSDDWSLRASLGGGFFAPTPFTEEVEAGSLRGLIAFPRLRAERGRSASLDLTGIIGSVELITSVFGSQIDNAVAARPAAGDGLNRLELVALARPTTTTGLEFALRSRPEPFHLSVGYTLLMAREDDAVTGERRDVPLTPRHSFGGLAAYEVEDVGRAGIELYFTGRQPLAEDPFLSRSESYVHIGILLERRIGPLRVFVNGENLLDYRQTRAAPLVAVNRPGSRIATDVWGPLEGRVINAGIRF